MCSTEDCLWGKRNIILKHRSTNVSGRDVGGRTSSYNMSSDHGGRFRHWSTIWQVELDNKLARAKTLETVIFLHNLSTREQWQIDFFKSKMSCSVLNISVCISQFKIKSKLFVLRLFVYVKTNYRFIVNRIFYLPDIGISPKNSVWIGLYWVYWRLKSSLEKRPS